jgi:hypothetical protein
MHVDPIFTYQVLYHFMFTMYCALIYRIFYEDVAALYLPFCIIVVTFLVI